jgi:hypothetical protein
MASNSIPSIRRLMQDPPCELHTVYHAAHVLGIREIIEFDIRLVFRHGAAQGESAPRTWSLKCREHEQLWRSAGFDGKPGEHHQIDKRKKTQLHVVEFFRTTCDIAQHCIQAAVIRTLRTPTSLAAQICHEQNPWVVDQVGSDSRCVHHGAYTVSVKLRAQPNAGTHQDDWRSDRTGGDRDSFSVNVLGHTARFDLDPMARPFSIATRLARHPPRIVRFKRLRAGAK